MDSSETRIRRIAQSQQGTFTRRQALAVGFTDWVLHSRVVNGQWQRLDQGVYLFFGEPSDEARLAAAVAALPAVASHGSAAKLHRLRGFRSSAPEVTVPHRFSNRFAGVTVHESTDLEPAHVAEIDCLPVTSVSRTIFDLAIRLKKRQLRGVADDAIVRRLSSPSDLAEMLACIGRRGRPGTAGMRLLVDDMSHNYVAPESVLEQKMLNLLDQAGLPIPIKQMPIPWRTSVDGRVDLAYARDRVLIECDSRRWHTLAESFQRDRRRDNLAQGEGWRILRFTWEDITQRPHETIRQIRQVLAQAA